MIRNNPLSVALVTVLLVSALASCWCTVRWFFGARELQSLEFQFQAMNRTSSAMQALVNDCLEYSRRNPAMDSVLQQFDVKPKGSAPTPPLVPKTTP